MNISAKHKSSSEECHRAECSLRMKNLNGQESCLMESIRQNWQNPNAKNYCQDSAAKKFVDLIHEKAK